MKIKAVHIFTKKKKKAQIHNQEGVILFKVQGLMFQFLKFSC
jgi:hypothetical protein